MYKFALPLATGTDPNTGYAALGFSINDMFITNPFASECSRFEVNPTDAYGLSMEDATMLVEMNTLLEATAEAALKAGLPEGVLVGEVAEYLLEKHNALHG